MPITDDSGRIHGLGQVGQSPACARLRRREVESGRHGIHLERVEGRNEVYDITEEGRLSTDICEPYASSAQASADIQFTDKETAIFERQLEENGGLDTHTTAKVLGKRPAEVLRFSYIWKNKKLKIENDALKAHVKVHSAHARQNKTLGAPSLGRIRITNDSDGSDDEVSLYNGGYTSAHKMQCAACMTRESSVWWRCPRTITGDAMCEGCG